MKKLLFLKIFICFFAMKAQNKEGKLAIEKGTWNIGGQLSLSSSKNEIEGSSIAETNNFNFSIKPNISYFLENNVSIGLIIGYGYYEDENFSQTSENSNYRNEYSVAPNIRKLFPINNFLAFSLQGELGYSYSKFNSNNSQYRSTGNTYTISLRPGGNVFITKKLAFQSNIGALQYLNRNNKSENIITQNVSKGNSQNFNFHFNASNISFGLSYYL